MSSCEACVVRNRAICAALDTDRCFKNLAPYGEPQLGRRGIYRAMGGTSGLGDLSTAMLWVLQLSDGQRTVTEIVERSKMPDDVIRRAVQLLQDNQLIG